jgi:hypothetical protein
VPAGQNFSSNEADFYAGKQAGTNVGGVRLLPPIDSSADLSNVKVLVNIFDPDTNTNGVAKVGFFDVTIDAVAGVPNVAATIGQLVNGQAAVNITTSASDADGSERITLIRLSAMDDHGNRLGLPWGITFNKGVAVGGEWHINPADLVGLKMNVPSWYTEDFKLGVMSVVQEINPGTGSDREFDYTNNETIGLIGVHFDAPNFVSNTSGGITNTVTTTITNTNVSNITNLDTGVHTPSIQDIQPQGVSYFDEPYNQPGFIQPTRLDNFNAAEGDTLDLTNVISMSSHTDLAINDFVFATSDVNGVMISSGGENLAQLQGVDSVNLNDIIVKVDTSQI